MLWHEAKQKVGGFPKRKVMMSKNLKQTSVGTLERKACRKQVTRMGHGLHRVLCTLSLMVVLAACATTGPEVDDLGSLAKPAPTADMPVVFSSDFDLDTATTVADLRNASGEDGPDGVPDFMQDFDPANLDPDPANANGGEGLKAGQEQPTRDGDTQIPPETSVQVDVVSDAATVYPGAFTSNALLIYDGNDTQSGTSPSFPQFPAYAALYGEPLVQGSLSVEFYDPEGSDGSLSIQLGNNWLSSTDRRIRPTEQAASISLENGVLSASGDDATTALSYEVNRVNTLKITFDAQDTSKGANGTYTFQINDGPVGSAGFVAAVNPDRFSINNGLTSSKTSGIKLIDNITVAGLAASSIVAPTPVQVSVDWDEVQTTTSQLSYGMNGYSTVAPIVATDPKYGENLSYMNAGFLRLHYANLMRDSGEDARGWGDDSNETWDRERISTVLDAVDGYEASYGYAPELFITIPNWPSWMKTYTVMAGSRQITLLDPSEYDNFAAFAAELVQIVNLEQGRNVKYFEITNERDQLYYVDFVRAGEPDRLDELIEIYNRTAVAMKAVDPTIQVGGPAFTRGDLVEQVRRFVQGTVNNLDFLSYHFYASGDLNNSDAQIYDRTKDLARHSQDIVDILAEESPERLIPAFLNEYNISFTFRNNDPRMQNHKGAVFDALAMIATVDTGTSGSNAWNDRDGVYGKLDFGNNLRLGAQTFQLFNNYLIGERVATTSSNSDAVTVFAVENPEDGRRSLLVVNRSPNIQRILTDFKGTKGRGAIRAKDAFDRFEISAAGYSTSTVSGKELHSKQGLTIPDNSVTLLTINE